MTGLIVGPEDSTQKTLSGAPAMVMAHVKPLAMNYAMFVNPFTTNVVKSTQIHSWWYEDITWIDAAQRNSDPRRAYILVVNESSQPLFSSLTLHIRLSQRWIAAMQQWHTAASWTSFDSIYVFRTQLPTEVRKMVAWLLARNRFTCPRPVREVSSKFPSCIIVVLTINLVVQVSICSDWYCGSYSPDIVRWHTTNANER